MGYWKVIVAEATTNQVLNPSAETTGNFAAVGGGAHTRSTTYQRYGLYSYRIQTAANNEGGSFTMATLANAIHYATLRVRGTLPTSWDWSVDNANYTAPTLIEQLDANWALYGVQFPAVQCNGQTTFYVRQNGAGAGDFYIDGVQVEELEYWTTYVDGDQEGCEWDGAEHGSSSTRSASSAAGGRQRDLTDDYSFDISGMIGLGTAPQTAIVDEYALLPGGEINFVKVHPRPFTLTGVVRGTSYSDLHTKLSNLEAVLNPNTCPIRLRYTGSTTHKEIAACYDGGMEGNITAEGACYWQRMAVRFIAEDPYFYAYGGAGEGGSGEAATLATFGNLVTNYVAGRLDWAWDNLDTGMAGGVSPIVHALAEDTERGLIYAGGNFANAGGLAVNNISAYDIEADDWLALTDTGVGLGTGTNNTVRDIAIGADGMVYAVGEFTSAGGIANCNYVGYWNPTNDTWNAMGVGLNNIAYAVWVDANGDVFVGGEFTDVNGGPGGTYNRIIRWDGAAWNALDAGGGNNGLVGGWGGAPTAVTDINQFQDSLIYMVGNFDAIQGGVAGTYDGIISWDPDDGTSTAWGTVQNSNGWNTAANNEFPNCITISPRGDLYVGGQYSGGGPDGIGAWHIAMWNGTAWTEVGGGLLYNAGANDGLFTVWWGHDNNLYVGGLVDWVGSHTYGIDGIVVDMTAVWNGSSWSPLPLDLGWAAYEFLTRENNDLYIGHFGSGNAPVAQPTTVTNNGTSPVRPRIHIHRTGGTSATLFRVLNSTSEADLKFEYALQDGEELVIDTRPTVQSIVSSIRGSVPEAMLADSDFGDFSLLPGDNVIYCLVNEVGGPTVTAWMEWTLSYRGL